MKQATFYYPECQFAVISRNEGQTWDIGDTKGPYHIRLFEADIKLSMTFPEVLASLVKALPKPA